ncbi:MAG: acetate/propionate family kinase [Candidatus Poribacteria bacterium]|nr:acetate/propionate family kinase [Candidatus Poribacteria bacterium]
MKVLVSNVGSSSFKFRLFDMTTEREIAQGGIERVGNPPSRFSYQASNGRSAKGELDAPNHRAAIDHTIRFLMEDVGEDTILPNLSDLSGVGFKTVFAKGCTGSAVIDESVVEALEAYIPILPVHNPAYIAAIRAFEQLAPIVPRVAVFETWFHETMPPHARELGVPREWVEKHAIRRYGFHGASHRYVSQRVPQLLADLGIVQDVESLRVISCHLGGSSSVCAIRGGQSVDTSMAFSAQSGVLQGTRCGDLDAFVALYMIDVAGWSVEQVQTALMRDAGLAGISGVGSDMVDILNAASNGNENAQLALDTYHYGVKKYVGAYAAALGGVDALAFTGGIGEKGRENRAAICEGLEFLNIRLDANRNAAHRGEGNIASEGGIPILVVPANEEIIVARETARLVGG